MHIRTYVHTVHTYVHSKLHEMSVCMLYSGCTYVGYVCVDSSRPCDLTLTCGRGTVLTLVKVKPPCDAV